jgi:hypothetical protein
MNPEIEKIWIEALLSGEYKQGSGYLKLRVGNEISFCCLGVLCDLYQKQNSIGIDLWIKGEEQFFKIFGEGKILPVEVKNWAELNSCRGLNLLIDGQTGPMTEHNDRGASFAQIAEAMKEKNPLVTSQVRTLYHPTLS